MAKIQIPKPLFDSLEHIDQINSTTDDRYAQSDIKIAGQFLKSYIGSKGTFNSYRREVERLIHWCALISNKTLKELRRENIEEFIKFSQKPPKSWIGTTKPPRFIIKDGLRIPNPTWRPFIVSISKAARRSGTDPENEAFNLSHGSLRELFAILSSFYNYMLQEEYVQMNPVAAIRQKSKFIRKIQGQPKIRRLSELQWHYVFTAASVLADQDKNVHERTLFMLSALYSMYLRISELAETERFQPAMNHFSRDEEGHWWFTTVGKGNKERQIAVSDVMLTALKRWRKHLGLSSLPSPADNSPLLPKNKGTGGISSTNYIRKIVQLCFDSARDSLIMDKHVEEAQILNEVTVHWLRHTGISEDVKIRPREHVRDDAGHSSGAITDHYINVERRERHRSAKKKRIVDLTTKNSG